LFSKGGVLVVGSVRGLHTKANSKKTSFDWFLTGFTDAEGCFLISIRKSSHSRVGWNVEHKFQIGLHEKDEELLKQIQAYFGGVGKIRKVGKYNCVFIVRSLE